MFLTMEALFSLVMLALIIVSVAPLETADYSRAVLYAKASDLTEVLVQKEEYNDAARDEYANALGVKLDVVRQPVETSGIVIKRTVLENGKYEDVYFIVTV